MPQTPEKDLTRFANSLYRDTVSANELCVVGFAAASCKERFCCPISLLPVDSIRGINRGVKLLWPSKIHGAHQTAIGHRASGREPPRKRLLPGNSHNAGGG